MVVGRRPFNPCPPSPARAALDPKAENQEYITAWLSDLAVLYPDLQTDLPGYAKALCNLGYKTFASLAFMHPDFTGDAVAEVQKALKINVVLAKAIVAEALALHPRDVAATARSGSPPQVGPRRRSRSRSPPPHERRWQAYSDKLNGGHTILESELKRFMES